MNTVDRKTLVPQKAPPPPDAIQLRHFAWVPMWVENSNAIFTVVGDPGDGKSWASLRCAEVIDPTFTIDRVAWNIVDFMRLVLDDSIGQGQVIILEEGEVEADAHNWHSTSNRVFRTVLDTWRHQNRMAIINLPTFNSLEKGARRRTDAIIEMTEAKPWKDHSNAKFKEVNFNNIDDHFSTPFPKLNGKVWKRIKLQRPSRELRDAYEERKEEYTTELNERLLQELLDALGVEDDDDLGPREIADDILSNSVERYIKKHNNGTRSINTELIEVDYDVGHRVGKRVKAVLESEIELEARKVA